MPHYHFWRIIMITKDHLVSFFEDTKESIVDSFLDPLNKACDKFEINTPNRLAMFLAQVGHESGGLVHTKENLNYKADGLTRLFPHYFKDVDPEDYAHNPEKIANRVYANRMGNGDEASGDGYKYCGRGLIQLTGFSNYSHFADDLSMSIDDAVHYLETPEGAAMSAAWFWNKNGLNSVADAGDILKCTKRINGGTIGLDERTALYEEALKLFA
jgi:putative chitinase